MLDYIKCHKPKKKKDKKIRNVKGRFKHFSNNIQQ